MLAAYLRWVLGKLGVTSALNHSLHLAEFCNMFADNVLRRSLLRSGAAYTPVNCKSDVLQLAQIFSSCTDGFSTNNRKKGVGLVVGMPAVRTIGCGMPLFWFVAMTMGVGVVFREAARLLPQENFGKSG